MPITFTPVDSVEALDAVIAESYSRPVFLFKHSSTCGISLHIREQLSQIDGEAHIIVVQDARSVSDAAAVKLATRHASPQAFVLRNGSPVYHATHYGIDPQKITEHLKEKDPVK